MSDRQREREAGGGALTGATGDLVPPEATDELLTGERREIERISPPDVTASAREPEGPLADEDEAGDPHFGPATGTDQLGEEPARF